MAFSVTVVDNTAIDPVSSIGVNGSGWVVSFVTDETTNVSGTLDASQLVLTVQDPGYTNTGSATTVTRTIKGVINLRRVYPNGGSKLISTSGGSLTILITLDDFIYTGSTITSATITSSFYTGVGAGSAATITNNSSETYTKPQWGWVTPMMEAAPLSFDVEGVAANRHGMNSQQIGCVKMTASDGTNSSATVTVSQPYISKRIKYGYPPETWQASMDMTNLTQAAAGTVNAVIYPWIGNSSNVLTLPSTTYTWPDSNPQIPLRFTVDKTGGYSGALAYVDGVGAGTPQVSTTVATARANPYASVGAALTAIKTFNNANKGHNDIGGGRVRLMDAAGQDTSYSIGGGPADNPAVWCYIERDPAASGQVAITWSGLQQMSNMLAWGGNGLLINQPADWGFSGQLGSNEFVMVHNCTLNNAGNRFILQDRRFLLNIRLTGSTAADWSSFTGGANGNIHLMAGIVGNVINSPDVMARVMLGNIIPRATCGLTGGEGTDGNFVQNCRFMAGYMSGGSATYANGFAVLQNLFATDAAGGNNCMNMFADGDLSSFTSYVEMYNSAFGERCSHLYNDVAGAKVTPTGLIKKGTLRFNLWSNFNIKSDTFNAGAGSCGNAAIFNGVGCFGNLSLYGAVGQSPVDLPHNDNADTPYLGNVWHPTAEPNLGRTASGLSKSDIMRFFKTYLVNPKPVAALNGDYSLKAAFATLKNRVPAGMAALKYDILGNLRKNDGTGAAGAFEWVAEPLRTGRGFRKRNAGNVN